MEVRTRIWKWTVLILNGWDFIILFLQSSRFLGNSNAQSIEKDLYTCEYNTLSLLDELILTLKSSLALKLKNSLYQSLEFNWSLLSTLDSGSIELIIHLVQLSLCFVSLLCSFARRSDLRLITFEQLLSSIRLAWRLILHLQTVCKSKSWNFRALINVLNSW